jgi:hypothetical protein
MILKKSATKKGAVVQRAGTYLAALIPRGYAKTGSLQPMLLSGASVDI